MGVNGQFDKPKVAVIDAGLGNYVSVLNMVRVAGGKPHRARTSSEVVGADLLILPGVGAFDRGIRGLRENGLWDSIQTFRGPLLGICLGMQLLGMESEEGILPGLEMLPMRSVRFREAGLTVPHMGWNEVSPSRSPSLVGTPGEPEPRYYFAHSYHADCPAELVTGWTLHGSEFPSAVAAGNVHGVQFHPEKSHGFGLSLIKRFLELA